MRCGSQREHQPDARVDEVIRYGPSLNLGLVQVVESMADQTCPELIEGSLPN